MCRATQIGQGHMRVIDCIRGTDSHWVHNGRDVIVCPPINIEVEKLKELVRLTMVQQKENMCVDIIK